VISKLQHRRPHIALSIYNVFQESYAVEAKILQADDFPPLKRPVENFASSHTSFYGYTLQDELAGVIELQKELDSISIESLVVKPSFFRKGIGQQLIQFVLDTYQSKKYTVETGLANEPAINLYAKFGFEETRQWDTDFGVRKIRFEKISD